MHGFNEGDRAVALGEEQSDDDTGHEGGEQERKSRDGSQHEPCGKESGRGKHPRLLRQRTHQPSPAGAVLPGSRLAPKGLYI
jgi:hypothetical protein